MKMNAKSRLLLVSAIASAIAYGAAGAARLELEGEVAAEQAVAAAISPALYSATSRRPDALAAELRVLDGSGRPVPYATRPFATRVATVTCEWRKLSIVSAKETDGALVVTAEWPDGAPAPQRLLSLKVATPLADFDEHVIVYADDTPVAEGDIFDKRRFADVRRDEIRLDAPFGRTLTVVFTKAVSEEAHRDFVKTSSPASGQTVRRAYSERAFRVDSLSVSSPKEVVSLEYAPPFEVSLAAKPFVDAKARKTVVEFDASFMPVVGVALDVKDRNFSRMVRVMRRENGGWRAVASGRIGSVDLPDEKGRNLEISLGGELREGALRVEMDDMDDGPLKLADTPVTLKVRRYDAVFIAKPGETYSLAVEKGARKPRYDLHLINHIAGRRDLARFEAAKMSPESACVGPAESTVWIWPDWNPVTVASIVAFVVLCALAFALLRSK